MNINEAFPSNYLKAADLQGRNALVKIDRAEYEMIGKDKKLVLYFIGKEKGMVCNKTNANNIAHIYGDETEDWHGHEIVLFEAMVDYQGKTVPAIRIRPPQKKATSVQQKPKTETGNERHEETENYVPGTRTNHSRDAMDDEIPFAAEFR